MTHAEMGSTALWLMLLLGAATLNRMVLLYAVPMGLFAGTVSIRREVLSQDIPLVIALCAAIIGAYVVMFLFSRFAFRAISLSALAALAVSAPAVPFMGPVLGDLFGTASAVPIGIASLIIKSDPSRTRFFGRQQG